MNHYNDQRNELLSHLTNYQKLELTMCLKEWHWDYKDWNDEDTTNASDEEMLQNIERSYIGGLSCFLKDYGIIYSS